MVSNPDTEEKNQAPRFLFRTKNGINPTLGTGPKKYAARFYQLKVGNGAVGTFLARIMGHRNPRMLVVWGGRAVCRTLLHKMSEMEKGRQEKKWMVRELYTDRRCKMLRPNEIGWKGC